MKRYVHPKKKQKRIKLLTEKAEEIGLDFIRPDGAMYLFAKSNKEGFDGIKFAKASLERGLAIAPGEGFGDYKQFIRISACRDEKTLMDGMNILSDMMRGTI